uniref:Uncharacterized protein n=1 Tax=Arundo donax TaxID=35708 RepID=A0A0A9FA78_ARUDO
MPAEGRGRDWPG